MRVEGVAIHGDYDAAVAIQAQKHTAKLEQQPPAVPTVKSGRVRCLQGNKLSAGQANLTQQLSAPVAQATSDHFPSQSACLRTAQLAAKMVAL